MNVNTNQARAGQIVTRDAICRGGNIDDLAAARARDDGRARGASTGAVYLLFTKHMRDSGLPPDVLVGKLKKDISFALRRGTTIQTTTASPQRRQRADENHSSRPGRRRVWRARSLLFFRPTALGWAGLGAS